MFYTLTPTLQEIALAQRSPDQLTAGYITAQELPEAASHLGYPESVVTECLNERGNYRNTIDVYETYTFGIVNFVDPGHVYQTSDRVAFFLQQNLFLVVCLQDLDGSTYQAFDQAIHRFKPESITLEKVIYALLENSIARDAQDLAKLEFDISNMEEAVAQGKISRNLHAQIFERKKRLLILQNYYDQLMDVGEELQENENEIFGEDTLHYFALFSAKADRLNNQVQRLMEELNALRAAHQSAMDYSLNSVMKIFTVITSIFLPLTLIVGWYGMNFTHMPEISSPWGYPFVILLSLFTVVGCLLFFKRKKLL